MGSALSTSTPAIQRLATYESPMKNCLRIERIIASGCDYLPPSQEDTIRVGVIGNGNAENPLSNQAIRLGDSPVYRLQSFYDGKDSLTYTFEKDISLTLMKRRDSIVYNLKTPELDVTKEIYPGIIKMFKPIGMASEELDKMDQLFQSRSMR
jgi:hypothetical protein